MKAVLNLTVVLGISFLLSACDPKDMPKHTVQICNENTTAYRYIFSIAYYDEVKQQWVSNGWWHLEPTQCVTPITGRYAEKIYIHGKFGLFKKRNISDGSFLGDVGNLLGELIVAGSQESIEGNNIFCVHPESAFEIEGSTRCVSRGYENAGFVELNVKSYTNTLIEFFDGGKYRTSFE